MFHQLIWVIKLMCIHNFVGTIVLNFNYINNTVYTKLIYSSFLNETNLKKFKTIKHTKKEKDKI